MKLVDPALKHLALAFHCRSLPSRRQAGSTHKMPKWDDHIVALSSREKCA
jgi:hypothetical protein